MKRSASVSTSILPLFCKPRNSAGEVDIQFAISLTVKFLFFASVQSEQRANCNPAIPPHALERSPEEISFISGGAGEWSVATKFINPDLSASQSLLLFALSRIGGAHLKIVSPFGMSSALRTK